MHCRNTPSRAARSIKRASSSSSWPTWLRTTAGTEGRVTGRGPARSWVRGGDWLTLGLAWWPLTSVNPSSTLYLSIHPSVRPTLLLLWPLCLQLISSVLFCLVNNAKKRRVQIRLKEASGAAVMHFCSVQRSRWWDECRTITAVQTLRAMLAGRSHELWCEKSGLGIHSRQG